MSIDPIEMWTLSHYHEMRRECQIDNIYEFIIYWGWRLMHGEQMTFFYKKKTSGSHQITAFTPLRRKKNFFDLRIYPIPSSLSVCFMYLVKFMKIAHLQHPQQQHQPSNEHFESELNFPSKKFHEIFRLKFKNERILALNMAFFFGSYSWVI